MHTFVMRMCEPVGVLPWGSMAKPVVHVIVSLMPTFFPSAVMRY